MPEGKKIEDLESNNEQLIEAIVREIGTHKDTINFTLRQANGKIDQKTFQKIIISLRDDLHNITDRVIRKTGGSVDSRISKTND